MAERKRKIDWDRGTDTVARSPGPVDGHGRDGVRLPRQIGRRDAAKRAVEGPLSVTRLRKADARSHG